MHAFINDDEPLFSGLLFSETIPDTSSEDNFLHAYEIYNLDLNADLVILSACNTGAGAIQKGEGVMSLARAFAYAGCPNTVMALWQADDAATKEMMQIFHQYLSEGYGKAEALQLARGAYLEQSDRIHPFYWGAFVLMGDDLPVISLTNTWLWISLIVIFVSAGLFLWRRRSSFR